ncbi:MAG TPA: hypothetical protein VEN82_07290 [Actinomycetota bacterium]|nr:hypothetical protein [Actinomycetota bacterium]
MKDAPRVNLEPEEFDDHHVVPVSWQGAHLIAPETIRVTPDQHRDIHVYIDLLVAGGGTVPWAKRRRHGKQIRDWANAGYARALKLGLTPRRTL